MEQVRPSIPILADLNWAVDAKPEKSKNVRRKSFVFIGHKIVETPKVQLCCKTYSSVLIACELRKIICLIREITSFLSKDL